MTGNNDNRNASAKMLQEAVAMVLRIAGTVAGAVSLIFAVGFVIVNLSLLKHGVYEGALLRERYVAAGISFILLLAGAATIALAAHEVSARLLGRPTRYFHLLLTVALVVGAYYVLAVAAWGLKEYRAFSQSLLVWILASGCLVLLFLYSASISRLLSFLHKLYAASISRIQSFLRRVRLLPAPDQSPPDAPQAPKSPPENGDEEPPQAAKSPLEKGEAENAVAQLRKRLETPSTLTVLGILLFVLLIIYGGYVYDTLPAALGGGLPVVVQFAGDEANIAILAEMGVPLENPSTTGQLEFIGQTENRYYIFVREINWEESPTTGKIRVISRRTALAFDKELVLGVRYYPSEYYLSDDFAAVTHVQQGDELAAQEFYDGAIDEYTEALDRRPDFHLAFFRRGQAYLIKALNTSDEGERLNLAGLAVDDMAKASKLNRGEALYLFHLARAQTLAGEGESAVETLRQAIERDATYRDQIADEPLFEDLKVQEDLDFAFEELVFGSAAEAARAYAAQGQEQYAASFEADEEQVDNEQLTGAALAYIRAISLTASVGLTLENASYRDALAVIYNAQGKLDLATAQWEKAMRAAPDNESYRLRLARAYTDQDRLADAARQFDEVLTRNAQNLSAWLGKGEVLRRQGDDRQAADAFERASELAPERVDAWYGLGVARLSFAPDKAEMPFRRAVTLDANYVTVIGSFLEAAELATHVRERLGAVLEAAKAAVQGDAALREDDLALAIDAYRKAIEADPDNISYLVKLGDAYRSQGDAGAIQAYADAVDIYRSLIEQESGNSSYHFRLATVYRAQGEDAEALNAYNAAINLTPDVAPYFAARADLYTALGRFSDAIADFNQAITLEPSNHLYRGRLGRFYYNQKRYDEAVDALKRAIELNDQYATGFYYLGLAHLNSGDADAARTAFANCDKVTDADEIQRGRCQDQLNQLTTPTP